MPHYTQLTPGSDRMPDSKSKTILLFFAGITIMTALGLAVIVGANGPRLLEVRALRSLMKDEVFRAVLSSGGEVVDLRMSERPLGEGVLLTCEGRSFELPGEEGQWTIKSQRRSITELESERLEAVVLYNRQDLPIPASTSPDCLQFVEVAILPPPTREYIASLSRSELRTYRMIASGRGWNRYMQDGATVVYTQDATSIIWHGHPESDHTIITSFCTRGPKGGGMRIIGDPQQDRLAAARMVAATIHFE